LVLQNPNPDRVSFSFFLFFFFSFFSSVHSCTVNQVKTDVRSDRGAFAGMLQLRDWDLLQPLRIRRSDFDALRMRLGGFSEIARTCSRAATKIPDHASLQETAFELINRVNHTLNMAQLTQEVEPNELLFAGGIRRGTAENRLLLTIVIKRYEVTYYFVAVA
jgi:hypothetical protein